MDGANFPPATIRKLTIDDIPWVLSLAHERYAGWDPGGALTFLVQALNARENMLLLCGTGRDAFLVATRVAPPWYPKRWECQVMVVCAKPGAHWQAMKLLRCSVAWAKLHGCLRWRFYSETEHDVGPLCRRLGATTENPHYMMELG